MQFCTRSPLDDSQPAVMVVGFGWFDWACAASSASSFRLLIFKLDCLGISPVPAPAKLPLVPISHPSRLFRTPPRSSVVFFMKNLEWWSIELHACMCKCTWLFFQRYPLSRILSLEESANHRPLSRIPPKVKMNAVSTVFPPCRAGESAWRTPMPPF